MKNKVCFLFALCLINFSYGQTKYESGEKFEFDTKAELNPEFVLADNYNTFLLSVTNTDGMMAKRQMIVRKFDQTNKMVDKFTYDFPKFDIATLYNYLGYAETKDGKVVVFTETYSGKAKKSVVYKHEFDKATSKFTSTELFSNTILSASKSGTVTLEKSDNGNFVGINYLMYRAKEEAEKNVMIMLDAKTLNVAWQKEFSFPDKFFTKSFAVTNSGKVVYLRNSKGFKQDNYFVLATSEGQEEKRVETEVTLHKPKAISIGAQEYVLAFNYPSKGIRRGDFGHLLLFDLNTGKIVQNAPIEGFNSVKNIKEVEFTKVTVQSNEIHVFTEAKAELEMKTTQTVGGFGSGGFPVKEQKYGPGFVHVLGLDGTIKSFKKLATYETTADLYHSYGLIDIKGTYYVATGNYYQNGSYFGSFFPLNASAGYDKNKVGEISLFPSDPLRDKNNVKYINQLIHYFPDSSKLLFARIIDENQMSLLQISGVKL